MTRTVRKGTTLPIVTWTTGNGNRFVARGNPGTEGVAVKLVSTPGTPGRPRYSDPSIRRIPKGAEELPNASGDILKKLAAA